MITVLCSLLSFVKCSVLKYPQVENQINCLGIMNDCLTYLFGQNDCFVLHKIHIRFIYGQNDTYSFHLLISQWICLSIYCYVVNVICDLLFDVIWYLSLTFERTCLRLNVIDEVYCCMFVVAFVETTIFLICFGFCDHHQLDCEPELCWCENPLLIVTFITQCLSTLLIIV